MSLIRTCAMLTAAVATTAGLAAVGASGQQEETRYPVVTSATMPLYPKVANAAQIYGVVSIRVRTDGQRVTSMSEAEGPPLLVAHARDSIATWEFNPHEPVSFVVTYRYILEGAEPCGQTPNSVVVANLPTEVSITSKGLTRCYPTGVPADSR